MKRRGITLVEMLVVISIAIILMGLGFPAIRALHNSFGSTGTTQAIISAALNSARGIALKNQTYAGVRFQRKYQEAEGPQYVIFIIQDPTLRYRVKISPTETEERPCFRAVEGLNPIKLPVATGVVGINASDLNVSDLDFGITPGNIPTIEDNFWLRNISTFSIIFSPTGHLTIREVRVRNREGWQETSPYPSSDDIFNRERDVIRGIGMFCQDDYPADGLTAEYSKNAFVVYESSRFQKEYRNGTPFSGYIINLSHLCVNRYSGEVLITNYQQY